MQPRRVVVRADAGARVGTGHVIRCLSLAAELRDRGARVTFVTDSPPSLHERIRQAGSEVIAIHTSAPEADQPGEIWSGPHQLDDARETLRLLDGATDILVVDHYGLDSTWERVVATAASITMVIDDLANREHCCDVVTDQNWYGPHTARRYDDLLPTDSSSLLGPRYAILQSEYRSARLDHRDGAWPPRRVLVSFGGSDSAGETEKVLRAFSDPEFAAVELSIVVGSPERVTAELRSLVDQRPQTELHAGVPSLAPLLRRSDLAIGASGAATWERMCLDVPAVVATTSPHQSGVTAALADAGLTHWVGLMSDTSVESYRGAIRSLSTAPRPSVPPIVDGFGTARLAEHLVPTSRDRVTIRPGCDDDVPSMIGLKTEATGVGSGLLEGPAAWLADERRTRAWLSAGRVEIVEAAGVPIGALVARPEAAAGADLLLMAAVAGRQLEEVVRDRLRDRELSE